MEKVMDSITTCLKFESHKLRRLLTRITVLVSEFIVNYLNPEWETYTQSHLESIESDHVLPKLKYRYGSIAFNRFEPEYISCFLGRPKRYLY